MPESSSATPSDAERGITPWMLYLLYTKITLMGFGGTMFWIRRCLVDERKWFTESEFAEYFALGQLIPGGANLFNMALLVGHRFAGVRGAVAAGLGFVSMPFFVMVVAALLYVQFGAQPQVNKALAGMFAVVVGMMIANVFKMSQGMPRRLRPWLFTLVTFAAVGLARWPLVSVMAVLVPIAVAVAWRDIAAARRVAAITAVGKSQ
mgnify:CR=1 FL=1